MRNVPKPLLCGCCKAESSHICVWCLSVPKSDVNFKSSKKWANGYYYALKPSKCQEYNLKQETLYFCWFQTSELLPVYNHWRETKWQFIQGCLLLCGERRKMSVTEPSPLSAWWDGDLERLFSLRSFLKNRLTKVLDRCRLVLPSPELFSFCCFFFFCLSSKGGKKRRNNRAVTNDYFHYQLIWPLLSFFVNNMSENNETCPVFKMYVLSNEKHHILTFKGALCNFFTGL